MTRRKPTGRRIWMATVLVIAAIGACLAYQFVGNDSKTSAPAPEWKPKLTKTGSGVALDYSDSSQRLVSSIVQGLTAAKLAVSQDGVVAKETRLTAPEAKVLWQVASIVVSGPPQDLQDIVRSVVGNSGGHIVATENDDYQNHSVVRMDVGIADMVDGEPIGVTVCKLYLVPAQATPAPSSPTNGRNGVAGKAKLAIIIDDVGNSYDGWTTFMNIDRPLTFSVLPYLSVSQPCAQQVVAHGGQVMLHVPMEAVSVVGNEAYRLKTSMADDDIRRTMEGLLTTVPQAIGVNNHQGSKATADARVMKAVLSVIREHGLFFVDSRTSSQSVAYKTARSMGVRAQANDHFIDNDSRVEAVKAELRHAANIALSHGSAVVIGHARANTATAIADSVAELERQGVQLVFVSELLD